MLLATTVSASTAGSTISYQANTISSPEITESLPIKKAETIEDRIIRKAILAGENPVEVVSLARCESTLRQFKADGTVLRGLVNPKDVGLFQINETYHLAQSQKLGMNIYTEDGNIDYALWLVKHQGYKPWLYSRPCHRLV